MNCADNRKILLVEYQQAQDSAHHHDRLLWTVVGSLLAGQAVLFGFAVGGGKTRPDPQIQTYCATLGLALSLFVVITVHSLASYRNQKYSRCREIERQLGMKQHLNVTTPWPSQRKVFYVVALLFAIGWINILLPEVAQMTFPFLNLLVGWSLGLLSALLTVEYQHSQMRKSSRSQLAAALAVELDALYLRYRKTGGELLKQATDPKQFPFTFSPHQNYFIVFDSNAGNLGLLERNDAERAVAFYVKSKGFFDNLINYGKVLQAENQDALNYSFNWLKQDDAELSAELPGVLAMLRGYVR